MSDDTLNDLEKLEKLSLVSKVCTELENHLGLNDKDAAEYIIHLAEKNDTYDKFKKALVEVIGDSVPESFIANLLRIIQRMNPTMKKKEQLQQPSGALSGSNYKSMDVGMKKVLCPALALPDQKVKRDSDEEIKKDVEEKESSRKKDKKKKKKHRHSSSSSRSRSRSPKRRHRSRSRSRSRENRKHEDKHSQSSSSYEVKALLEPVVGDIYEGIVSSIMQFGCFVQLKDFRKKTEGLVHISNLREEGRVNNVADVVQRHQKARVKVISVAGTKIGLSMKDVDQFTGKDLNPQNTRRLKGSSQATTSFEARKEDFARNPDRPDDVAEAPVADEDFISKKKVSCLFFFIMFFELKKKTSEG